MSQPFDEMCNQLGTMDARLSAMMDACVDAGLVEPGKAKVSLATATQGLCFVAQLLRMLEPHFLDTLSVPYSCVEGGVIVEPRKSLPGEPPADGGEVDLTYQRLFGSNN